MMTFTFSGSLTLPEQEGLRAYYKVDEIRIILFPYKRNIIMLAKYVVGHIQTILLPKYMHFIVQQTSFVRLVDKRFSYSEPQLVSWYRLLVT